MKKETASDSADTDWENRILCKDESCIGVIGPDGKCKECGLPYNADIPGPVAHTNDTEASAQDEDAAFNEEFDPDTFSETITDEEWNNRRLCSDENCIGVIGPDGKCKECGKPFLFPQND
ncbi:MAG: hypothetical protein RBT11_10750 [Desulfobacterales bacterium]|jgi:hypothetical protein|nr:hypothetical protein [Desulfobacterales bacterium]